MMFTSISYLKFLLTSNNQHGVHSPFVFNFVTKGLYQKLPKNYKPKPELNNIKATKKQLNLIHKIVNYYQIDYLQEIKNYSSFTTGNYYNSFYINILDINLIKEVINSKSFFIIIIPNCYQSETAYKNWNEVITLQNYTISIDLFYLGLIFNRPQQQKEHFKIRA